jgi:hypothetical protein
LGKAHKSEIDLGFGEPPLYEMAVAVSMANAHMEKKNYDFSGRFHAFSG